MLCYFATEKAKIYSLVPQVCEMVIHICMASFPSISEESGLVQDVYNKFAILQRTSHLPLGV